MSLMYGSTSQAEKAPNNCLHRGSVDAPWSLLEKVLVEEELLLLLDDVLKEAPEGKDPYLAEFEPEARAYVSAGADLFAMSALATQTATRPESIWLPP